jgi:hypothetical protein
MAREAAVQRAARRWQECALYVRGELRAQGCHGELRRLDDYVNGSRGAGMAKLLADFAAYCRDHGLPANRVAAHLGSMTADVVADAYTNDKGAA